jgi:hypothetical protein
MSKKIKPKNKIDLHEDSPYRPKGFPKSIRRKLLKPLSSRSVPYGLI